MIVNRTYLSGLLPRLLTWGLDARAVSDARDMRIRLGPTSCHFAVEQETTGAVSRLRFTSADEWQTVQARGV